MVSKAILTLNEDNFDQEIKLAGETSDPTEVGESAPSKATAPNDQPILVDFWASWCPPCKAIEPTLNEIADELIGRARIGKVDVDDNGDLANRFGIRSIPTLVVFKHGKVVDQLIGAAPKEQVRRLIEKHLS